MIDERLRSEIIAACLRFEHLPDRRYTTVRDDITGPIVDSLHTGSDIIRKELSNGVIFDFYYRSKIARDFVMSVPERPNHVWEPQTTKLLLYLANDARDVIVGGAYFGDQAILLAHALRSRGGRCHAFEADAEQAVMLEHNAQLNALDNVRVNTIALWSDTVSRLGLVGYDALASTAASDDGVATTTIDAYLRERDVDAASLIMLDLEGAELAALRGAEQQLSLPPDRAPHLVFEVHRSYLDWSKGLANTDICRYVASLGYTIFAVRDFQSNIDLDGRPIELVPPETAYLEGPPHGFNVFATKRPEVIANDGFRICPGVSPKLLLHRDPALHHPIGGL